MKQFKPNKSDITVSIGFMSLAASLVSIFLLTQHLNLTWPASLLKCLEEGKCICGIWLLQFFSHPPTCSCLAKRSFADRDIAGNSQSAVMLHDIDFYRQTCGTLTFSPGWCTTAASWTRQALSGQIHLFPILRCVSITAFWLSGWLIDHLSCSLLNRGVVCCDWYQDCAKSLSSPPTSSLLSKSYLRF